MSLVIIAEDGLGVSEMLVKIFGYVTFEQTRDDLQPPKAS